MVVVAVVGSAVGQKPCRPPTDAEYQRSATNDQRPPLLTDATFLATPRRGGNVFKSEATTRSIRVRVQSSYVPERSAPDQNSWFFIYTVEIANQGHEARSW